MAGVDEASVSLVRRDRFETTSATSAEVRAADGVQYQFGKGPCIEATQQAETINIGLAAGRAGPSSPTQLSAPGFRACCRRHWHCVNAPLDR